MTRSSRKRSRQHPHGGDRGRQFLNQDAIRVGRISAIYPEEGTARIIFEDKTETVSQPFPFIGHEIWPYKVDDMVWVLRLSRNPAVGMIIGRAFSEKNLPAEGTPDIYRKDFAREAGKAYVRYEEGGLTIYSAGDLTINCGGSLTINAPGGDVTVNGISLKNHTHTCPDGQTGSAQ